MWSQTPVSIFLLGLIAAIPPNAMRRCFQILSRPLRYGCGFALRFSEFVSKRSLLTFNVIRTVSAGQEKPQSRYCRLTLFRHVSSSCIMLRIRIMVQVYLGVDSMHSTRSPMKKSSSALNAEFLSSILVPPRISQLTANACTVLYSSHHMYCTLRC